MQYVHFKKKIAKIKFQMKLYIFWSDMKYPTDVKIYNADNVIEINSQTELVNGG